MTSQEITLIICPYCHHHFKIASIFRKNNQQIEFGTVYCHCDEFPIIFGILYLHRQNTKNIITNLRKKHFFLALSLALNLGKFRKCLLWIFIQLNKIIRISPANFINKFLIMNTFKLSPSLYHYYFHRHQEKESYLFFIPLFFLKSPTNLHWLDIGSGLQNHYRQLHQSYPEIQLITLEKYFQNIFLSRLFYPEINCLYLCSDISTGPHFLPNTLDCITFIDSLPFIEKQKETLLQAQVYLKKNGYIYASSLVEHLYANNYAQCYPTSIKLIDEFFPNSPSFFDEKNLVTSLFQYPFLKKSLLKKKSHPYFRYSLIWPSIKPISHSLSIEIPQNTFSWKKPKIQWRNSVY